MDVFNRRDREEQLEAALNRVWTKWTDVEDPQQIHAHDLVKLLDNECAEVMWWIWYWSTTSLNAEIGVDQTEEQKQAMFLTYFRGWTQDITRRWTQRINNAMSAGRGGTGMRISPFEPGKTPSANREPMRAQKHGEEPGHPPAVKDEGEGHKEHQPDWMKPRETTAAEVDAETAPKTLQEVLQEAMPSHDLTTTATTTVTQTQSDAEHGAANHARRNGRNIEEVWRTELGACKRCAALEGKPKSVWRRDFPSGPPAHPNCRCWIEHVPY